MMQKFFKSLLCVVLVLNITWAHASGIAQASKYNPASVAISGGSITGTTGQIVTAQTTANTAVSNAATAQTTANTAVSNAATAQTTANTAVSNAATAQTTANTAVSNAATAQTTANTAVSNALTASSYGTNGYAKIGTLYIQWGTSGAVTTSTPITVTLPIACPTALRNVVLTGAQTGLNTGGYATDTYTTTSFRLYPGNAAQSGVHWQAVCN